MQVTEWYPAEIKPVHVGWYETKGIFRDIEYPKVSRYWDGSLWLISNLNVDIATSIQDRIWRGLTEPFNHV